MTFQQEKKPVIRIAFLDVGQGDTIVVTCPETHEAIVVDCIDDKAVLNYLRREEIEHLRGVIVTHVHTDHSSVIDVHFKEYHQCCVVL